MDEAVRTTASPAAIWVIVIVMSIMTMILISAAAVADSWQARVDRRVPGGGQLGPAIADVFTHTVPLDMDAVGADMSGAGRTDAAAQTGRGDTAAWQSTAAEEGMSRAPVPAQRQAGVQ
jgi:hypothetical protein